MHGSGDKNVTRVSQKPNPLFSLGTILLVVIEYNYYE